MTGNNHQAPPLARLVRRTLATGVGALQNRGELFVIELQEEKTRAIGLLARGIAALVLGMVTLLLATATVIFLFPQEYRVYVAGGFTFLYLAGTAGIGLSVRAALQHAPFSESLAQLKKDAEWLRGQE